MAGEDAATARRGVGCRSHDDDSLGRGERTNVPPWPRAEQRTAEMVSHIPGVDVGWLAWLLLSLGIDVDADE